MRPSETLQALLFRRQFLLGPSPFRPTEHWTCFPLYHGLILSTHPDIKVFSESQDGISVTLIGFAIDTLSPHKTTLDIVRSLIRNASGIREVINLTNPFAGRWVVIFQDQKGTYLFTDPCGFRQIFYHSNDRGFWCGSQPEIIKAVNTLVWDTDGELLHFMMSPNLTRTESSWVGTRTPYANCYHLMPNHYLDVHRAEQVRFFPNKVLKREKTSAIVESAVSILQGAIAAVAKQQNVLLALTAGWDSRVLLAASRHYSRNIEYFMDRQGVLSEEDADVWVPKRLARELGINFVVKNSADKLPGWFVSMLAQNVTGVRILPKSGTIYARYMTGETRININGNGSEICRNFYDKYCRIEARELDAADLAGVIGYKDIPFVEHEIEKWRDGLYSHGCQDMNVLDMFYWEQKVGNWGAQYPAEQDIAIEEFSPFNCRLLIVTLLAAPRPLRSAPGYTLYRELIQSMWPEALSLPINPEARTPVIRLNMDPLKRRMRPYIPSSIVKLLKQMKSSW